MEEVKFVAQISNFNRKALRSGDTQIRLIIDCVDNPVKQNKVMEGLSDVQLGDTIVEVAIREYHG